MQRKNFKETPNEAPENDERQEEQKPRDLAEKNWQEIEVDTVKDLLDVIKHDYEATEDAELKQRLAHQIVKIEIALGKPSPSLEPKDIKVRVAPEGVLGYYEPESGRITLDRDMLSDFTTDQTLMNHVAVHESLHKEGISDEGMVELMVKKLISAKPGIYPTEQKQAKSTFYHTGVNRALELYDIENPDELVKYFLEVELEKRWNEKLEAAYKRELERSKKDKLEILEKIAKEDIKELEKNFEDGVERLYDKLKIRGFDCKKVSIGILEKLAS